MLMFCGILFEIYCIVVLSIVVLSIVVLSIVVLFVKLQAQHVHTSLGALDPFSRSLEKWKKSAKVMVHFECESSECLFLLIL